MSTVADLESNPRPVEEDENTLVPQAPGTAASVPSGSSMAHPTIRKASSGFTNLKKYLTANKDNNLIGSVTNEAQQKLTGAQQNLGQEQQKFQANLASERAKLGTTAQGAQKALQYVETGTQPLIQEAPVPAALVKPTAIRDRWSTDTDESYKAMQDAYDTQAKAYTENQVAREAFNNKANQEAATKLQQLKNYKYAGPQGLNNLQDLSQKQFELQDYAKATGSEAGRAAILQTLFGKTGQYSGGARSFDTALLGAQPSNLDKLRQLRSQTVGLGQNIKQAQQQATAGVGSAKSNVDLEQANSAAAMKTLRDKLFAQLKAEADAANVAGKADVGTFTDEELRQNLVNRAGYTLEAQPKAPVSFSNPGVVQMGQIRPTPGGALTAPGMVTTPGTSGQIGLPVQPPGYVETPVDPATLNYINLNKNKNFQAEDIGFTGIPGQVPEWDREPTSNLAVNPNRSLIRKILEKEGFGDFEHTSYGKPNVDQTLIDIKDLKPLFSQTYQDNTAESINTDLLNRRNVLSQILQDDAANGTLTPQERQEVQTQMNDAMLTKLKQTPKMQEEAFVTGMLGSAPGREGLQAVSNYKQLGYDNPVELMKELRVQPQAGVYTLAGNSNIDTMGWNPRTQSVILGNGQQVPWEQYKSSWRAAGWDNNSTPGKLAQKIKEKMTLDRLKQMGINEYTTQFGKVMGPQAIIPTYDPIEVAKEKAAAASALNKAISTGLERDHGHSGI